MNVQNLFEEEDPRFCDRPSLKNGWSARQIPVSQEVAERFQYFVANFRGRSPYPQLFLNNSDKPLGSRGVSDIMQRASLKLSPIARQTLIDNMREPSVRSHDFRHTCAVVRLAHFKAAGMEEADALQRLRGFL